MGSPSTPKAGSGSRSGAAAAYAVTRRRAHSRRRSAWPPPTRRRLRSAEASWPTSTSRPPRAKNPTPADSTSRNRASPDCPRMRSRAELLAHTHRQPADQVPLEDEVDEHRRQRADQRTRHLHREVLEVLRRDRLEANGDRAVRRRLEEEQSDEEVVPDLDELEYGDRDDRRHRERQHDSEEDAAVADSVDQRGLDHILR